MIHHVFANRSNIGDWLAARGIQSLLGNQPIIEHFCDEPFAADTLRLLSDCTSEEFVVIGGGGLFMDYFTPFWEGFRTIAGRLRFCIWGVGYCDLKRENSRPPATLLKEVIGKSQLCVVRDDLTWRYLADCHLPEPVICPSVVKIQQSVPEYGLLHVDNYTTAGANVFEAMEEYGQAFAQRTGRRFLRTNNRLEPANDQTLNATLQWYAAADMVLTSALHGCIVALAMGRKVLAVSGDHKIESFMQAVGLGGWVVDIGAINELPERLDQLASQPSPHALFNAARESNRIVGRQVLELISARKDSEMAPVRDTLP